MNAKTLLVCALAALCSCSHKTKEKTPEGFGDITVDVALPETDSVQLTATYPGYLIAESKVDVVARVNGTLLKSFVEKGKPVQKGAVMYIIESTAYRDAVQQASASLATARSERDYASSHYEAVKKALESDAVSKMEVEQAHSSLQQAEAAIKNALAALESAQTNLGYCTVRAPISGVVTNSSVDVGNYLSGEGAAQTLCTIYDYSTVTANFAVEDTRYLEILKEKARTSGLDLSRVPLQFSDSLPHEYYGSLSYMAPAMDQSTGTLMLQCKIDNKWDELRPGMFVKVLLPYEELRDAVLVKDASISSDQLGKYLYVVNDSDKVVYTPVVTGPLVNDTLRVVTQGLAPGMRYVTKALLKVRNGMHVKPKLVK